MRVSPRITKLGPMGGNPLDRGGFGGGFTMPSGGNPLARGGSSGWSDGRVPGGNGMDSGMEGYVRRGNGLAGMFGWR